MLGIGALVGTVAKLGGELKKTFTSIQATGDKWNIMVKGMTAGWEYFKRSLITSDWKDFFKNIGNAITAGREFAKIMDELGDRTRSFRIEESEANQEISDLQNQLKNVNLANEERIKIADKIIDMEDRLADRRRELAQTEFDAIVKNEAAKVGFSEQELTDFVRNYENNRKLIEQTEKYISLLDSLYWAEMSSAKNKAHKDKIKEYQQGVATLREEVAKEGVDIAKFAEIYQKYLKTSDDGLNSVTDAWVKLNNITTEYNQNISRASARRENLIKQENKETVDHAKLAEDAYKRELDALEKYQNQQRISLAQQYLRNEITKQQYDSKAIILERDLLLKKIELNKKYSRDVSALQLEQLNQQIKQFDDFEKALDKSLADLDAIIQKNLDDSFKLNLDVDSQFDENEISDSVEKLIELFAQADDIRKKYQLQSLKDLRDAELDAVNQSFDAALLSEKEYISASLKIYSDYMAAKIDKAQQFVDFTTNLFDAYSDAQFAKLEAQKQKELALAGEDAEKQQQIEEQYAQKQLDLEKKQADVKFAIQIAQIISSTALAIMQAFAQLGPIGGAIAAALLTATGFFQAAAAKAERDKVKNMTLETSAAGASSLPSAQRVVIPTAGFSDGGYTGAGDRLEPAGIVHRGEYVVAQPELRNPAVLDHVRAIDHVRRQRKAKNSLPGFADGGYTGDNPAAAQNSALIALLQKNVELLEYLKANGIEATTVFSYNEFDRGQKRLRDAKTAASK
jgi:DNA repair exonuclease SbcCD ATPase subunit